MSLLRWVLFLCVATTVGAAPTPDGSAALVPVRSPQQVRDLSRLGISIESVTKGVAHVWIDGADEARLRGAGFTVNKYVEGAFTRLDTRGLAAGYHTPEACVTDFQAWAAANPEVCRLSEIGKSVEGRPILGLKITTNPDAHGFKPLVRICGAHHGNEVMSCETVILYTKYLLDNYKTDPQLGRLVADREIWIVPMVNPDGVARRSRHNANGVDLNRNYGYNWTGGWKNGTTPYSEPEVKALRDLHMRLPFALSLSFHCSGDIINYVWNYTPVRCPDQDLILELSNGYQSFNQYEVTEGFDWYETHGDTNDFSYGCRGNMDWTIEIENPAAAGIPGVFARNRDAITYMIAQADRGVAGVVTDSVTGQPLEAMVEPLPTGWPIFTHPTGGDFHRVLPPGSYQLRVWAPGHKETIVDAVEVSPGLATRVDVALEPLPDTHNALGIWTAVSPDDEHQNKTHGPHALGPADGRWVSLAAGGHVVLDLSSAFPTGSRSSLTVHEAVLADDNHDAFAVATSAAIEGPWTDVGQGVGTTTIEAESLQRFIRITDATRQSSPRVDDTPSTTPGFDLDAITVKVTPTGREHLFRTLHGARR